MSQHFAVPGNLLDWDCPDALPWNEEVSGTPGYLRPPARGLGDTLERILDATGIGPVAKKVITTVTGKPCGCTKRRDRLNQLVSYPMKPRRD